MEALRGQPYPFLQENQLFRGAEKRFDLQDGSCVWGEPPPMVGRGAATGGLDLDGDPDVVVSNNNGPAHLCLNQATGDRWLRMKLAGRRETARDSNPEWAWSLKTVRLHSAVCIVTAST